MGSLLWKEKDTLCRMLCFKQETSAEEGSIVVAIFRLYLSPFFEEELYIKIEEVT